MEKPENNDNYYEDRINLFDYIQVVWRWKFIIVGIVVLSVIVALLMSFRTTPVYRVSASLSPESIEELDERSMKVEFVPIDSITNIVAYINGGIYNPKIFDSLDLDPFDLQFHAEQPGEAYIIDVYYETTDPAKGMVIVGELLNQIEGDYSLKITLDRYRFKEILNDVVFYINRISLLKIQENENIRFSKMIDENTASIMKQRDRLVNENEKEDQIVLFTYLSTIQQNIAYVNTLNLTLQIIREDQIFYQELLKVSERKLRNEFLIKEKLLKNADIRKTFSDLLLKYDYLLKERPSIKNFLGKIEEAKTGEGASDFNLIRVVNKPYASSKPIKPKRGRMVLISVLLSLFLGFFLALFTDFIKRNIASFKQT